MSLVAGIFLVVVIVAVAALLIVGLMGRDD